MLNLLKLSVVLSHYLDNDTSKVLKEEDKLNDMERTEISQGKAATEMDVQLASQGKVVGGGVKTTLLRTLTLATCFEKCTHTRYQMMLDYFGRNCTGLTLEIMKVATVGVTSASFLNAKSMETITSRLMPGKWVTHAEIKRERRCIDFIFESATVLLRESE